MSRPATLPEPWLSTAMAVGGVSRLAEILDVTRRTVHRWAHGLQEPSELQVRDIRTRLRRRGLPSPV
jgi:hypothetical protein